jgi:transcriptional regulator with XRE-family HTH domain
MANILDIQKGVSARIRLRRREAGLSQAALAERSGVSLGSIKRFEGAGDVSLASLVRIAAVLGCEADFEKLFTRRNYQPIDEVTVEGSRPKGKRMLPPHKKQTKNGRRWRKS